MNTIKMGIATITAPADTSEVIGDMKLLLEQTDDTVRFAEDTRSAERHTVMQN